MPRLWPERNKKGKTLMKRTLALILIALTLVGCADERQIDDKVYETYGLANQDEIKDPNIVYRADVGSIVCAVIFSETLIVPVYIIGWDLWEPVRRRETTRIQP